MQRLCPASSRDVLSEPARSALARSRIRSWHHREHPDIPRPIVPDQSQKLALRRLLPHATPEPASVSVEQLLDEIGVDIDSALAQQSARPYLLLNMASTADGRASIGGRSGPIGDRADSEMLHGLRTVFDALLIGAQTARAEGYARIVRDDRERAARRARGLPEEPLTCIVTASLDISPESVPLLTEPHARIAIVTASSDSLSAVAASVQYVRAERNGALDLAEAMRQLRASCGVSSILCEGGPTLATQLVAAQLVDELFLCFAPKLAGGRDALRILAGSELQPPADLRLVAAHEHDSQLFLRYALRPAPQRREA